MSTTCVKSPSVAKPAPLAIQEQGSFAVGGAVVTNPGTFDPYKPTADRATLRGDHAYVFYQVPVDSAAERCSGFATCELIQLLRSVLVATHQLHAHLIDRLLARFRAVGDIQFQQSR